MGWFAAAADNRTPSRGQVSWFLFFRLLIVSLFLGGTIVYQVRAGLGSVPPALSRFYFLIGLYYLQALLVGIFIRQFKAVRCLVHFQVVWDLLFVTTLIYLTGGTESIFPFIYLLSIVSASFFLGRKETLLVASASVILYGSLLDLQYYGYLPRMDGVPMPAEVEGAEVFYAVFVHVIAFFLVGVLSGTLSHRLGKSVHELERREIDYEELENLNRTILANIGSALMIINPGGRIRSFNEAATYITGYSLEAVYDRPVKGLFPSLGIFDGKPLLVERGEGTFVDPRGGVKTLGFRTSSLCDLHGKSLGLLVTFQDLTQVKDMEQRLHRSDRLAAVGRLASGLAHEIRNPLASISGSVQLLMEGAETSPEDRKLMEIVVKEADRLSGLLTDFLVFARPTPPELKLLDISCLLDELSVMVESDRRFSNIEVVRGYAANIAMRADRSQIRQALWNLLINAADAMPAGGRLILEADPGRCEISVGDSGPGIAKDVLERIFDPFFTTKDSGSGLGLATVYAIVQGHGGEVLVGSSELGGAWFTIRLPDQRGA